MKDILAKLDWQSLSTRFVEFLPNLLSALGILFLFWLVYRATRAGLSAILRRAGFHETLVHMLVDNVYRVVLIIFGLVMAADQVGIDVGAALAGIGVAGIAIGFAAQDSLANMIAGFLIFWDKPFQVGDWVTVSDQYGQVSSITMRTTRIRTNNNTYVVIPNKNIIDQVLVNHSKHGETRIEIPVGIAYKESIPDARRVILQAIEGIKGVLDAPHPDVVVQELGDSSVNLKVRVWIGDAAVERPVFFRVLEAAKVALDEAGIQIPFPHLQLFVDDVEERVLEKVSRLPQLAAGEDGDGPGA
jgi:small conductance mechanosensitive channel